MSQQTINKLAEYEIRGKITLAFILENLGYEIAERVYNATIERPFQIVKWTRRIR